RPGNSGVIRDSVIQSGAPQAEAISDSLRTLRSVKYQLHPAAQHQIDNVGTAIAHFVDSRHGQAVRDQGLRSALGGNQSKTHFDELSARLYECLLILIPHRDKDPAFERQVGTAAELRLRKGTSEIDIEPHYFSGRLHLGAKNQIDAGETRKWKDGLLNRDMATIGRKRMPMAESARVETNPRHY